MLLDEGIYTGMSCINRVEIERVVEVVDGDIFNRRCSKASSAKSALVNL